MFVVFLGPVDDHGSSVIFRSVSVRPIHLFDPTLQTMITTSNSLSRGSGMPIQVNSVLVRAMSDTELSRVRTELDPLRILPTVPPHPVQPNRESSSHRHLGNTFLPTHCQVHIPTPPVRIPTRRCLCCFYQQETQQGAALFGDVSQPLMAGDRKSTRLNSSHLGISYAVF